MKCLHCHPSSSNTSYRVHTTFDDTLRTIQHHHGMSPWQHLCEYTPRFLSLSLVESEAQNGGVELRVMKCLHCHPSSSNTSYRVHTTFDDTLRTIQHHHGMSPWQHLCEYTPRFLSLSLVESEAQNGGVELRVMKCLHCHPSSSNTSYRVHTTFDDTLRSIQHH